jgi:hypothetical protein
VKNFVLEKEKRKRTVEMKIKTMVLAVAASVFHFTFANDYYVDASMENDDGDGKSAATAKKYLQSAINLVGNGDTVYVAPGRYNQGKMTCAFNDVIARVVITNKINLVATGRKEETIIDGGGEMGCVYVYRSSVAPKYTEADGTVIRNFTICNGSRTGTSGLSYGAGANIPKSYLIDCVVSNNMTNARGAGSSGGTAIRCLYADNYSTNYGSVASSTLFLNSVIVFSRGKNRLFDQAGMVVNCTIVGNVTAHYTYNLNSNSYLYNTIYAGNSSQKFQSATTTVASNCVLSAGTEYWSEELCGNISTDVPEYGFAGPAFGDWRPTAAFNIASHGDVELLKKFPLPQSLENERFIDYNGEPIPQTGSITCGAVQEICNAPCTLLKLSAGLEVDGYGITPANNNNAVASKRYAWVDANRIFKFRKSGSGIGDVVWYTLSTNNAFHAKLLPDTNNWAVVAVRSSLTNSISTIVPNATYYVDVEFGNNSNPGTADHPYATIQAAVDAAQNGTSSAYKSYVVIVKKGEYRTGGTSSGRVHVPNKVGSAWQYRNFRIVSEEGPEKTFIIGARGAGDDGLGDGVLRCCYSAIGTFIQGFTLTGGYSTGASAFGSNSPENGSIADCIVTNNCGGATFEKTTLHRCRIKNNKVTSADSGDLKDSIAAMCEIVQSPDSVSKSYVIYGDKTYVYFSAIKGVCPSRSYLYASILDGGQKIGANGGYARYCFAHGDPLVGTTGSAIRNCKNGKSRCRNFDGGNFRIRSDSPVLGMVTFDPVAYSSGLTVDIEGNLPPLDTFEGWAAGPRQKPSWEYVRHGMVLSFR